MKYTKCNRKSLYALFFNSEGRDCGISGGGFNRFIGFDKEGGDEVSSTTRGEGGGGDTFGGKEERGGSCWRFRIFAKSQMCSLLFNHDVWMVSLVYRKDKHIDRFG